MAKNKLAIVALVILLGLAIFFISQKTGQQTIAPTCTDTDGDNPMTVGFISYVYNGLQTNTNDTCVGSHLLIEMSCNNGDLHNNLYSCTCMDDKCIDTPTLVNVDVPTDNCGTQADGGINIFQNTTTHDLHGRYYRDTCMIQINQASTPVDECTKGVSDCALQEGFCDANGLTNIKYPCPGDCKDNACVPTGTPVTTTLPSSCTDSDGGQDIYVKGYASDSISSSRPDQCYNLVNNDTGMIVVDSCSGEKCRLSEMYCPTPTYLYAQAKSYECPEGYGCSDGACNPVSPTTTLPGGVTCFDTDSGKDSFVQGNVTVFNASGWMINWDSDRCNPPNTYGDGYDYVIEWYCDSPTSGRTNDNIKCLNGCVNGACNAECTSDSDCPSGTCSSGTCITTTTQPPTGGGGATITLSGLSGYCGDKKLDKTYSYPNKPQEECDGTDFGDAQCTNGTVRSCSAECKVVCTPPQNNNLIILLIGALGTFLLYKKGFFKRM